MQHAVAGLLLVVGGVFFLGGTIGLVRFPDTYARLHALTKADTLGLGFTVLGLAVLAGSLAVTAKLLFIWVVASLTSSTLCYLIAGAVRKRP